MILNCWYLLQTHSERVKACDNHFTALWILSGTTQMSQYQKKHSPTYTYRGHQSSLICFVHLLQSMASFLFLVQSMHVTVFFHNLCPGFLQSTSPLTVNSHNKYVTLQLCLQFICSSTEMYMRDAAILECYISLFISFVRNKISASVHFKSSVTKKLLFWAVLFPVLFMSVQLTYVLHQVQHLSTDLLKVELTWDVTYGV